MIPTSKPNPCNQSTQSCRSPTAAQLAHLFSSFALISIGAGGVWSCSIAFGADQLESRDNSKHQVVLETFFDHVGWRVGFRMPATLIFLSVIMFFIASPLYLKKKPKKSLFTGFAQVIVVAYRNRNLSFPFPNSSERYHHGKDSEIVVPRDKLRFSNKACITRNSEQDIAPDGSTVNLWRLCTIEQVEELKALIKVLPLLSTGIMLSINVNQTRFILIQASSLDRQISQNFEILPASFATFGHIVMVIWVILYDRMILPLASKIKGKPVQLGVKLRMGIGLLLSCMAVVVSAIVEMIRRGNTIQEGNSSDDSAMSCMPATWLVPQYCLLGLAEAFTAIGQTEFFYTELPKSMSSIAAAMFGLGMAVSNSLSSIVISCLKTSEVSL
ncbi:hypothetical protein SLEP1_g36296 [Rubroshorea leprosula]|uniref:Protein NRT1/ PTR FAMILY 1.2-like n=1 Tax=Rubroshorea leprosula TaxID=152421 RepID=A0AAV5KR11_9ROSI|nr:hypothetical protein SLEP1_g36296 [Rubroshorea leprosula]